MCLNCFHHINYCILLVLFAQSHQILNVGLENAFYLSFGWPQVVFYGFFVLFELRLLLFLVLKLLLQLGQGLLVFLVLGNQSLLLVSELLLQSADVILLDVLFVFGLLDLILSFFNLVSQFLYFLIFFNQKTQSFRLNFLDFVLVNFLVGLFFHHEWPFLMLKLRNLILLLFLNF